MFKKCIGIARNYYVKKNEMFRFRKHQVSIKSPQILKLILKNPVESPSGR